MRCYQLPQQHFAVPHRRALLTCAAQYFTTVLVLVFYGLFGYLYRRWLSLSRHRAINIA
jgi:hypothetical protein